MVDLIVVGGGPAGSSAAITAARAGASVLLLERGRFPRHKVCGEFVSAESLGLLAALLHRSHAGLLTAAPRINRLRLFVGGRTISARLSPTAASVARYDLDDAMWHSAVHAGVEARAQTPVQSIAGCGPFTVSLPNETIESRAVLNASGRWSNLRATGAPQDNTAPRYIGVKGHFEEAASADTVDLYFFEGGYCGVSAVTLAGVNTTNRVNACAMVRADLAANIADVLKLHPELRERSRNWQPLIDPVAVSPLIFREPEPVRDNMLRAGDAAAFVDPFTGDGISLALRSGALAAESLLAFFRGESTLGDASLNYARQYQRRLAVVYRNSSRLRQMLAWPSPLRDSVLFTLQHAPLLTEYLIRKTRAQSK